MSNSNDGANAPKLPLWSTSTIQELPIKPQQIITDLRLAASRNGYLIIPVTGPDFLSPDDPNHDPDLGKKPELKGWQQLVASDAQIRNWGRNQPTWTNTGILAATTTAIDADIADEAVAGTVANFIRGWFGEKGKLITRYGRRPRFLVPFNSASCPFARIDWPLNKENKIQILGNGQHFVCDGYHPVTHRAYLWEGGAPWTVAREELPLLSKQEANFFLDALIKTIERGHPGFITETARQDPRRSIMVAEIPVDLSPETVTFLNDLAARHGGNNGPAHQPFTVTEATLALSMIDPDIGREEWFGIGCALYKQFGDEQGFALWNTWSELGEKYPGLPAMRRQWRSLIKRDGYGWSIATVLYHANQATGHGSVAIDQEQWIIVQEPPAIEQTAVASLPIDPESGTVDVESVPEDEVPSIEPEPYEAGTTAEEARTVEPSQKYEPAAEKLNENKAGNKTASQNYESATVAPEMRDPVTGHKIITMQDFLRQRQERTEREQESAARSRYPIKTSAEFVSDWIPR
jgi:hypothetical protein